MLSMSDVPEEYFYKLLVLYKEQFPASERKKQFTTGMLWTYGNSRKQIVELKKDISGKISRVSNEGLLTAIAICWRDHPTDDSTRFPSVCQSECRLNAKDLNIPDEFKEIFEHIQTLPGYQQLEMFVFLQTALANELAQPDSKRRFTPEQVAFFDQNVAYHSLSEVAPRLWEAFTREQDKLKPIVKPKLSQASTEDLFRVTLPELPLQSHLGLSRKWWDDFGDLNDQATRVGTSLGSIAQEYCEERDKANEWTDDDAKLLVKILVEAFGKDGVQLYLEGLKKYLPVLTARTFNIVKGSLKNSPSF